MDQPYLAYMFMSLPSTPTPTPTETVLNLLDCMVHMHFTFLPMGFLQIYKISIDWHLNILQIVQFGKYFVLNITV